MTIFAIERDGHFMESRIVHMIKDVCDEEAAGYRIYRAPWSASECVGGRVDITEV